MVLIVYNGIYQGLLASSEFDGLVGFDDRSSDSLLHYHLLAWNVGPCTMCVCVCDIIMWSLVSV